MTLSSIPDILDDLRRGQMVIVLDDDTRENEGDLVMAASLVTPEAIAFMAHHGGGLICVAMEGMQLDALDIPLLPKKGKSVLGTAWCMSVDSVDTGTGISAHERAQTIRALASADSVAHDFKQPGHIFPLRANVGGVRARAGHTEASVELVRLAGLPSTAVICEIMRPDGYMARLPDLLVFGEKNKVKVCLIKDLIAYL